MVKIKQRVRRFPMEAFDKEMRRYLCAGCVYRNDCFNINLDIVQAIEKHGPDKGNFRYTCIKRMVMET